MKKIFLFALVALLSGCSAVMDEVTPERQKLSIDQRISTKDESISLMAPFNKNIGVFYDVSKDQESLYLYWATRNKMAEKLWVDLKDKVDEYPKTKRQFIDYIDGVKCQTFETDGLLQIYPLVINGEKTYTKQYKTYCPLNDKVVELEYEYSFNKNSEAFAYSARSRFAVIKQIESTFRKDIQAIFSTIKFNVDRKKMQEKGLLSNEPYKAQF